MQRLALPIGLLCLTFAVASAQTVGKLRVKSGTRAAR